MVIRFLFFLSLVFLSCFINNSNLYSACEEGDVGDTEKEEALNSGIFSGCGKSDGNDAFVAEFGTPQTPIDEDDKESELTPIEPTYYDNPSDIFVKDSSNVKFHFFNFKNNATIEVDGKSKLDLQLYENTSDITFKILDGEALYRGGSKGKIDVFLPNGVNSTSGGKSSFYSADNVNFVDFQGEVRDNGANPPTILRGGTFTVGSRDEKNAEKPASIVIDHLKGNGIIELTPESKLVIKHYDVNYDDKLYSIQSIRGRGEVIFDTEIYVQNLELQNATFNKKSKLVTVKSDNSGKHIFNANSDIEEILAMNNLVMDKNVYIKVNTLKEITEANLSKGAFLEILGEGTTGVAENKINKIQGEGTLHINTNYGEGEIRNSFKITDINLNKLIFDGGQLDIINSTPYYTNEEIDPETGEKISEERVVRRIKNITKNDTAVGGEILVQGTVIFDNINYLKKLTVCNSADTKDCDKNVKLTLKNVETLKELEVNGGKIYLELDHNNYTKAGLNLNSASFTGGEIVSIVNDTNTIKHKNTYTVLSVPDETDLTFTNVSYEDFTTMLPDWYRTSYYLSSDKKSLMLDAERLANYKSIISQLGYAGDSNSMAMASYFDNIINNQTPLDITGKTFTYVDLLSNNDYDTLARNLNSLVPLSKDKYLKTAHFNLKEALDVSKRKGIENKKPYSIWDRRQELQNPDNKVWFVSLASNGRYDAEMGRDEHDSTSYQFGFNAYNWVSNSNREGYTYSIVGGLSKGNLDNSNYSSNMSAFNIGNTLDYRDENDIIKLSFMYGLSSFNTEREYFISNYSGEDFPDLDKSKLKSSLQTHEFLFDIQYSHEIFVEYLKTFANFNNVIIVPRMYFTPSIFIGEGYTEQGEYSSLKSEYSVSTIVESGLGFDVSKGVNYSNNSAIKVYLGMDTFYRYYNFPSNKLHFAEVSQGINVDNSANWAGFVVATQTGVAFDYKKSQVSVFYKREIANDYFQNVFGLSYKYSF